MNFSKVTFEGKPLGYKYHGDGYWFFYGGRHSSAELIQKCFPQLQLRFVNQVHGNHIVPANKIPQSADGQWSQRLNQALCIKTADCLPVMIAHPKMATGLHAGWRGLVSGIIPKALELISHQQGSLSEVQVLIGPHIQKQSFEVGLEVSDQLRGLEPKAILPHPDPLKRFVNLSQIALTQMAKFNLDHQRIHIVPTDTMQSAEFESYRRDGDKSGRQLTFVALASDHDSSNPA